MLRFNPPPGWPTPAALGLLLIGLGTKTLGVVYLSIAVTIATLPLVAVGSISLARTQRRQ